MVYVVITSIISHNRTIVMCYIILLILIYKCIYIHYLDQKNVIDDQLQNMLTNACPYNLNLKKYNVQ